MPHVRKIRVASFTKHKPKTMQSSTIFAKQQHECQSTRREPYLALKFELDFDFHSLMKLVPILI